MVWNGENAVELQIVIEDKDFSSITVRDTVYDLMDDMESESDAAGRVENWLDDFKIYLNETGQDMDTMNSTTFYAEVQSYSNGTRWESEIIYDDPLNPTKIEATRFLLRANSASTQSDIYPQYVEWNRIFNDHFPTQTSGYVFYKMSLVAYLLEVIMSLAANNMIFALMGVFCTLVLFVDLRMSLFIAMIVAMIDINLFGWMWALDISLDSTAYAELVMAVGLTVDYVIHITHSIAEAQPQGDFSKMSHQDIYRAKLRMTMNEMGVSVWYVLYHIPSAFEMNRCLSGSNGDDDDVCIQQRCIYHVPGCHGIGI